jgi:polyferredoxin
MATVLSRTFPPTVLLYSFVVITQFAYGLYLGQQIEAPGAYRLLHWAAQLWIIGWWLRTDSRKRGVGWIYDMGFFLCIAWPLIMPYYLVKSRGAKGLLVILGFIGAYVGAAIIGIILSVLVTTLRA